MVSLLSLMKSKVLSYKNTDAYSTEEKAVEKLVYLWEFCESNTSCQFSFQVCYTHSHQWHDVSAAEAFSDVIFNFSLWDFTFFFLIFSSQIIKS